MTKGSERLVAYGFRKGDSVRVGRETIELKGSPEQILDTIKKKKADLGTEFEKAIEGIADQELRDVGRDQRILTNYPPPKSSYYVTLETWHNSIEQFYYSCLNLLTDMGFPVIDKITDIFSAAEHSSFYGASAQRLGLAQDKVAQYLATIGKMIKDLFQIVREIRIIDERLDHYYRAYGVDKEGKQIEGGPQQNADVTLKGLWVDLVDGVVQGQRTGSNLFTMAAQLQFTALPDLFFKVYPKNKTDIHAAVERDAGEFNLQVKQVLERKIDQYITWRDATFEELKSKRKFTLSYLKQHNSTIQLYANWVKPYLKHIERLQGTQELINSPNLIASFESSLVEIEVLARKRAENSDKYICIMLSLDYHTKPQMQFSAEGGYHRGPIHAGVTNITWRSYAWGDKEVDNFKKMKQYEDLEMLSQIDNSIRAAWEALGTDLKKYLDEAEGKKEEQKKEKKPAMDIYEPFKELGAGVKELWDVVIPSFPKKSGGGGGGIVSPPPELLCFIHYKLFKKANGLLSW